MRWAPFSLWGGAGERSNRVCTTTTRDRSCVLNRCRNSLTCTLFTSCSTNISYHMAQPCNTSTNQIAMCQNLPLLPSTVTNIFGCHETPCLYLSIKPPHPISKYLAPIAHAHAHPNPITPPPPPSKPEPCLTSPPLYTMDTRPSPSPNPEYTPNKTHGHMLSHQGL